MVIWGWLIQFTVTYNVTTGIGLAFCKMSIAADNAQVFL